MAGPALAQVPTPSTSTPGTCNPDFEKQMNARAWLGVSSDMDASKRLIKGTDKAEGTQSVLQLICFTDKARQTHPFSAQYGPQYINTLVVTDATAYLSNFGGFACKTMEPVWNQSKCENFSKDNILTLQQLVAKEIPGCTGTRAEWQTQFRDANPAPGPKGVDPQVTYVDRLAAKNGCGSLTAIQTGTIVTGNIKDAVCPSYKCYYDNGTCK